MIPLTNNCEIKLRQSDPQTWINDPSLDDGMVYRCESNFPKNTNVTWNDIRIYDLFINSSLVNIGYAFYIIRQEYIELSYIEILESEEGKGYGSFLLDQTCKLIWESQKMPIHLNCSSGDKPDHRGFNRYQWYLKHGFTGKPESWIKKYPI
jgi:hypothetical protein